LAVEQYSTAGDIVLENALRMHFNNAYIPAAAVACLMMDEECIV